MLTAGRNPPSQRVSECRRARERGGVQSGLRSSSLPSWCLCCCGNVCVGAGDKGPLSPSSPLFTLLPRRIILRSSHARIGEKANEEEAHAPVARGGDRLGRLHRPQPADGGEGKVRRLRWEAARA